MPNHVDSLSSPSESMSYTPPHFGLRSMSSVDSLCSVSNVSYSHSTPSNESLSSPLMRDFELATLSLTDTEHEELELTPTPPMGPPSASTKFVYSTPCDDILGLHQHTVHCGSCDLEDREESVDTDDVSLSYKLALDLNLDFSLSAEYQPDCQYDTKPHTVCPVDDIEFEESQPIQSQQEDNPFLLGLAIDIPEMDDDIFPEIESCDDEDDAFSDADPMSPDIDAEIDLDRKFTMKKYQYIENIGIGAYGIVDKVMHCRRQRVVAIKVWSVAVYFVVLWVW